MEIYPLEKMRLTFFMKCIVLARVADKNGKRMILIERCNNTKGILKVHRVINIRICKAVDISTQRFFHSTRSQYNEVIFSTASHLCCQIIFR